MDFRTQRRTLEVLSDLFQRKPQVGRVRFRPQRAGGGVGGGATQECPCPAAAQSGRGFPPASF